jgi:multiple antibiotic resistance protein
MLEVYLKSFTALIALLNPIGAIPIFINLTQSQIENQRRRTARNAAFTVLAVLWVSFFSGSLLLSFFGISIASFRIAGGLLILLIALAMLQAKPSAVKQTDEEIEDSSLRENVAVVPLGIPLLAGPGAISTVILYAQKHSSLVYDLVEAAVIALSVLVTWLCLRGAPYLARWLGKTGINVFTRIMGLIMAAIGVEFIAKGIQALFPLLMSRG